MNNYTITEKHHHKTVKDFLKQELGLSTKILVRLKNKSSGILLNGVRVNVRAVLQHGDILSLDLSDEEYSGNFPENSELLHLLDIIYEDGSIIVVNKPPYLPVHPSRNHYTDTLANILLAYFNRKGEVFNFRAVNRLDRNTSGILLIAKTKYAAFKLSEQIKSRTVKKYYTAFLRGDISQSAAGGIICRPIRREEPHKMRRICADDGEYALTEYKVINIYGNISEVEASPVTGRTHQLRVSRTFRGSALSFVFVQSPLLFAQRRPLCRPFLKCYM